MNGETHFYFDLDGLGSDWQGYVISTHFPHMTIEELNKAPNRVELLKDMYRKEPHLFYNLPVIEKYRKLLDAARASGCGWSILTSAGKDHHDAVLVEKDKLRWLDENFGVSKDNVIITSSSEEKAKYARPQAVLFDDFFRNCEEWTEQGGTSVFMEAAVYDADEIVDTIYALAGM